MLKFLTSWTLKSSKICINVKIASFQIIRNAYNTKSYLVYCGLDGLKGAVFLKDNQIFLNFVIWKWNTIFVRGLKFAAYYTYYAKHEHLTNDDYIKFSFVINIKCIW